MRKNLEKLLKELGIPENFLERKEAEFENPEDFKIYLTSLYNQLKRR